MSIALVGACATDAPPREPAAPLSDDAQAVAEELVFRSGLQNQLHTLRLVGDAVTQVLLQQSRNDEGDVAPARRLRAEQIGAQVSDAVDAVAVAAAVNHLAAADLEPLQAALAHYRDPRSDRIALAETEVATGTGQVRLGRFLVLEREQPSAPTRRAAVEQLVTLSQDTALYTALSLGASDTLMAAVGLAQQPTGADDQTRFVDEARRRLVWRTLFVYRDLDDDVLQFRLGFFRAGAGSWFAAARVSAAEAAVAAVTAEIERQMQQKEGVVSSARESDAGPRPSGSAPEG